MLVLTGSRAAPVRLAQASRFSSTQHVLSAFENEGMNE